MGRGDRKTASGKRSVGSFGNNRKKVKAETVKAPAKK